MKKMQLLVSLSASTAVTFVSLIVMAAQKTANITVQATVGPTCSISTLPTTMDFGTYDGTDGDAIANTTFAINCNSGTSYSLGLDNGGNYSVPNRQMKLVPSNFIAYQIYKEAGFINIWGDIGSGNEVTGLLGTGSPQSYTAYGKASSGQLGLPTGTYNDTVKLTVKY